MLFQYRCKFKSTLIFKINSIMSEKITFLNNSNQKLSGRLEMPKHQEPHNFVIFAHCFTCNKNLSAVKNISRALTSKGFGILRFDFTGLGESDGDFEDTNFSGNVADLVSAAQFLDANYKAPTLIIGHSLGGAASIFAASQLSSIKAVVTVGAPSNPKHVQHLFDSSIDEINTTGLAKVDLGGRVFTIKKQFVDDLETKSLPEVAKKLNKAVLVMHSPSDSIVGVKNAEEIYVAASHPKSFVSLDSADHLLTNKKDSLYVGEVIAGWVKRYLDIPELIFPKTSFDVAASLKSIDKFTTYMQVGNHQMVADEPLFYGGNDFGPSPYELVSAGLSACTVMTIQMYAKRKGWAIKNVQVHTNYSKEVSETSSSKIDTFTRSIKVEGDLDEKQTQRLLQIADKCPVHKTLHNTVNVITTMQS